jgi:hypothetical protein
MINDYLASIGLPIAEGGSGEYQRDWFSKWFQNPEVSSVLEIGFNTGAWAECVLQANPDVLITSVDIGNHPYIVPAHEYLKKTYGRHELVLGDSTVVVPKLKKTYDVIFIDGGHFTPVPYKDIIHCKALAHSKTTLFIDDFNMGFGKEVIRDFHKAEAEGYIGGWSVVKRDEDPYSPAWLVGKYKF